MYYGPCSMYYVGFLMQNRDLIEDFSVFASPYCDIDLFLCDIGN